MNPYTHHIIGNKYYCKYHKRYRLHITDKISGKDTCTNYARYIMEVHLGKFLSHDYDVHHIDGNALNDEISNLQVVHYLSHSKYHRIAKNGRKTKYPRQIQLICLQCNREYIVNHRQYSTILRDQRRNPDGNAGKFCSISCATTFRNLNKNDRQLAK